MMWMLIVVSIFSGVATGAETVAVYRTAPLCGEAAYDLNTHAPDPKNGPKKIYVCVEVK